MAHQKTLIEIPASLFSGKLTSSNVCVDVKLILLHFVDENKVHIVYSPHLDVSGTGNTLPEAQTSFEIAFEDFFDYTLKKKTLNKVLTGLGWTNKKPGSLIAPSFDKILKADYVAAIFENYPVQTFHQSMAIRA